MAYHAARFGCFAKQLALIRFEPARSPGRRGTRQRLLGTCSKPCGHEGKRMWDRDPYRDLLDEHTSKHHAVGSALIVLIAVGLLLIVLG